MSWPTRAYSHHLETSVVVLLPTRMELTWLRLSIALGESVDLLLAYQLKVPPNGCMLAPVP